jgi:chromosome segregation ATPase
MVGQARSVVSALEEFNRLVRELGERLKRICEDLDEACGTLAKIRLVQADIESNLKRLEEKVEELDRLKHRHFWRRK